MCHIAAALNAGQPGVGVLLVEKDIKAGVGVDEGLRNLNARRLKVAMYFCSSQGANKRGGG